MRHQRVAHPKGMGLKELLLLVALFSGSCFCSADTVPITAGEYRPWLSKDLPQQGFIAQLITESFADSSYQPELTFMPWKRAYDQAKSGNYAATAYWYPSEKRRRHFIYSDSLHTESTHFFYNKEKPLKQWSVLADLKGYKIGATDGYTYNDAFWQAAQDGTIEIDLAIRDELNMAKLIRGRIDLFPVEKHLGFALLTTHFQPHMTHMVDFHPTPLVKTTGHLLFSKAYPNAPKLVEAFNKGLQKLRSTGRYDELLELHVLKRESP